MSRATINGINVIVYDFKEDQALCYIPALNIKEWYKQNLIEVRYD